MSEEAPGPELHPLFFWSEQDVPQAHVDRAAHVPGERLHQVIAHLRAAPPLGAPEAFAAHRCAICGTMVGPGVRSDEVFVWPAGSEHYIEVHGIWPWEPMDDPWAAYTRWQAEMEQANQAAQTVQAAAARGSGENPTVPLPQAQGPGVDTKGPAGGNPQVSQLDEETLLLQNLPVFPPPDAGMAMAYAGEEEDDEWGAAEDDEEDDEDELGAAEAEKAEKSDDTVAMLQQYAPLLQTLVLPTDAFERQEVLKARIKALTKRKRQFPFLALTLNNQIGKLKAKLKATERQLELQKESEASTKRWRGLGQLGLFAGASLLTALTVWALVRAFRPAPVAAPKKNPRRRA